MWFVIAAAGLIMAVIAVLYLRRRALAYLDDRALPAPVDLPSDAHYAVAASLQAFAASQEKRRGRSRLLATRNFLDSMSDGKAFASTFKPAHDSGLKGEWVLAPVANPRRRVLYIHGGAWSAGSPRSHRAITDKLSHIARASVFAVDYRLLPEHRYLDGVSDCRNAYGWLLENGPEGPEQLDFLAVGGDSAGGSLALGLIAWVRDQRLHCPDAVLAFSPSTDFTMGSPSLRKNLATDPMLGPAFRKLAKVPPSFMWWGSWFGLRVSPSDSRASPLLGDLAGLPPTLIQASEAEVLLDDAKRYAAKAQAAGSPVELQTWPHMVHVWQLFTPEMPEAEQAFQRVGEFLEGVERARRI